MKTLILLAALAIPSVKAAVIQNDALILDAGASPYNFPFDHTFVVTSAPFLVVEVIYGIEDDFTFQYQGIAEAYALFRVGPGLDFNAAYVNSQPDFVNNWGSPGTGILTLAPGQSEYLAYWDQGFGPPRLTAQDTDLFGWALVTNSGGELVITSNATANGGGIRIGTLQQIPEPCGVLLLSAAAALPCLRRRRAQDGC
jgi:hypothetical protein